MITHTVSLTDTINPGGGCFIDRELIPLFTGNQLLGSEFLEMLARVRDYSKGGKQSDDITLQAVRRLEK
jgi:hypothetical protein